MIANIVARNKHIKSVLELGCSVGGVLREIQLVRPDIKLSGIDVSSNAIGIGLKKNKDIDMRVHDINKIGGLFAPNSFDLVITSGVMIYLNPRKSAGVIKNIASIAKHNVISIELNSRKRREHIHQEHKGCKMFSCDYVNRYLKAGGKSSYILDLRTMMRSNKNIGEARHLIWANFSNKDLIVEFPTDFETYEK